MTRRTPEERKRLLHIVVVGGGPTGVEFAGELSDFLRRHQVLQLFQSLCYMRKSSYPSRWMVIDSRLEQTSVPPMDHP